MIIILGSQYQLRYSYDMPDFTSTVTLYDNLITVFGVLKAVLRPQCLNFRPVFEWSWSRVYPIRPTFPQRGTLPYHTRLRSGLFCFSEIFQLF